MTSIYESYGIPTEVGTSMMKLIDYISIENPKFANEASYIPPELSDDIDHFDIVWTTNLDKSYTKRRKWNTEMAIREFLQNSLDAEHEKFGYDDINIKTESTRKGLIIEDRGDGITYKSFLMGGEDKECYLRGAYGEGMKIAALYMATKGNNVYLFSGDDVYKCYYSKISKTLAIVIGKSTTPTRGTKVLMHKLGICTDDINNILYQKDDIHTKITGTVLYDNVKCCTDMPNTVIDTTGEKKLYVRDIFVDYLDQIVDEPFYSYNLWWPELEPNRKNVSRISQLVSEVSRLLCYADPYFLENLITSNLVYIESPPHYQIDNTPFEIDRFIDFTFPDKLLHRINMMMSEYSIGAYTSSGDPRDILEANHEGITPIIIPNRMTQLFKSVPSVTDVIISRHEELSESQTIPLSDLTISELSVYNKWSQLASIIIRDVKMCVGSDKRSFYTPLTHTITMSIDAIRKTRNATFIHELSHALDYDRHHTTNDMTENFEAALATTGSYLVDLMLDPCMAAFVSRCSCMCPCACKDTSLGDMFADMNPYTNTHCLHLYSYPESIIIKIHGNIHSFLPIPSAIDQDVPLSSTSQINYDKRVDNVIHLLRYLIHNTLHPDYYEAESQSKKIDALVELIGIDSGYIQHKLEILIHNVESIRDTRRSSAMVHIYKYILQEDVYAQSGDTIRGDTI